MFKLEFSTDNAAFADNPGEEIDRILRDLDIGVLAFPGCNLSGRIRDVNGNTVGSWSLNMAKGSEA